MKSDLSPPSRPEVLADALSLGADTDAFASIVAEMRRAASLVPPASDIKAMEMGDYPSFLGSNRSLARSHAQSVCEIAERYGLDPLQLLLDVRASVLAVNPVAARELDLAWDGVGPWRM